MGPPISAAQSALQESLLVGFSAQQNGRLLEAAERYRQVLAQDPTHFDATHMLGVVQYHRGRFDDALRLLTRATELRPDVIEARGNLETVEMARQRERQLCRAVLPRLTALVERIDDDVTILAHAPAVDLVIAQPVAPQDEPNLESVLGIAGVERVRVWADAKVPAVRNVRITVPSAAAQPRSEMRVFFGTELSTCRRLDAAWVGQTLLVVTRDEPGQLIDRIRELSGEGRRRVGLLCAGAELARRLPLPAHTIVAQPNAGSPSSR